MQNLSFQDALRKCARKQIKRIRADASDSLRSAEAVHETRVALRRLRTLLKLARSEGDEGVGKLRKRAQDLADHLGRVRDLDVLMERLSKEEVLDAPSRSQWIDELALERKAAAQQAQAEFNRHRTKRWLRDAARWAKKSDSGEPLSKAYPRLLERHAAAVLDVGVPSDESALHRLRIEIKRLRYFLEFFGPGGRSGKALVATLTRAQDSLGWARDARSAAALASARGLDAYSDWLTERSVESELAGIAPALEVAQKQLDIARG